MPIKSDIQPIVRDIKRKTRKKYTAEEKIRIVLEGLRGEDGIAAICWQEGISPNLYYRWSKDFFEAGKRRLFGDTQREATSFEVTGISCLSVVNFRVIHFMHPYLYDSFEGKNLVIILRIS